MRFLIFSYLLLSTISAYSQGMTPIRELPTIDFATAISKEKIEFDFHGEFDLWYYRPQQSWVDENFSIFTFNLIGDAVYQETGFHSELRVSDTWYRGFYLSNVWFQEIYLYYKQPHYIFKVGKEYTHFGRFWDGSYYGNVMYFDGLKLSPDAGFSFEGDFANTHGYKLNYYLQYFVIDGTTNGSLDNNSQPGEGGPGGAQLGSGAPLVGADIPANYNISGRDTISIPSSHRRNTTIARVVPTFDIAGGELQLGLNYEYLLADIEPAGFFGPRRVNVNRNAVDLTYTRGPFMIFFEHAHQHGQSVVDYPIPQDASVRVDYNWTGLSYKHDKIIYYYNYSEAFYRTQNVHEVTQIPGFSYSFKKYLTAAFEYGYWYRETGPTFHMNDNSLNFYLRAAM